MRGRTRIAGAAAGIACAIALAGPSSAQAQGQCLYQSEAPAAANLDRVERSLLCLTNVHRVRSGLPALALDTRLGKAARAHSTDMVARDYFDHDTPEGVGPSGRAQAAGYPSGAGENIAAGSSTALGLFEQWRNSPGHNSNMLGTSYRAFGGGIVPNTPGGSGRGVTGTQMFGLANANTGDTGLDLYASSDACAAAKTALNRLLSAKKKKTKGKRKRAARKKILKRARARVQKSCQPL